MSPIIDIQRRMVEVGRIRMGHQVAAGNGTRPAKLEHFRLTSRDLARLEAAADLYGGAAQPWADREGEFELFTTTAELPILLLPGQTLSQWYETWSAGGCQRRCDGERDVISEGPCICDTEKGDRACKPTTRLSVMLPDVPGLGCWRLESHGYYAAVELSATAAMLEQATARGQLLPARIRIDQRKKIEGGKTTKYAVPVIDIDVTMRQALPGAMLTQELPVPGFTPVAALGRGVTVEQGLEAVSREVEPKTRNGRQAAPIGPAADDILAASTAPIPADDGEPAIESSDVISEAQRTLLWTTATKTALEEDQLRAVVIEITGQQSTKLIPRSRFDQVLNAVEERRSLLEQARMLTDVLLAYGREKGNEEAIGRAIVANRDSHAEDLGAHCRWLEAQARKAGAEVTA